MEDPDFSRRFYHLCNAFAEYHCTHFAQCLNDENHDPPTVEQEHTRKLLGQIEFEVCASLADLLNHFAPDARASGMSA
jgi:hypothetical protein